MHELHMYLLFSSHVLNIHLYVYTCHDAFVSVSHVFHISLISLGPGPGPTRALRGRAGPGICVLGPWALMI